jgi:hypothetical protein
MPTLDSISKVVLILLAIGFLAMGVQGVFTPDQFFGQLGLELRATDGRSELRTAYGGMFGGAALLFLRAAYDARFHDFALWLAAMIFGLFLIVRAYSMALDGMPTTITWVFIGVELLGLVVVSAVLRWRR